MAAIRAFTAGELEQLCRCLAEAMTGTQRGRLLADARIEDSSRESTKWRRLRDNLEARQQKDGHGNAVARFIQLALEAGALYQ